jgi:hypothetical protein
MEQSRPRISTRGYWGVSDADLLTVAVRDGVVKSNFKVHRTHSGPLNPKSNCHPAPRFAVRKEKALTVARPVTIVFLAGGARLARRAYGGRGQLEAEIMLTACATFTRRHVIKHARALHEPCRYSILNGAAR